MNPRRKSADIADHTPPSPAPTYTSTVHSAKDPFSVTPNFKQKSIAGSPTSSPTTSTRNFSLKLDTDVKAAPAEKHSQSHEIDSEKGYAQKSMSNAAFDPVEEPFDTAHPHYMPPTAYNGPAPAPQIFQPPSSRRSRRFPPLKILLPWTLALLFFLLSAWYTSIALGVRLFTHLHPSSPVPSPQPPINIVINGAQAGAGGGMNTVIMSLPVPTPVTSNSPVPGNGVDPDLGSNTKTAAPAAASVSSGTSTAAVASSTKGVEVKTVPLSTPTPAPAQGPGTSVRRRGNELPLSGFVTVMKWDE